MEEIEKLNYDLDLIRATIEQINKDLISPEHEIKFSGNQSNALIEISKQLENYIRTIPKTNNALQRWMYRVDIAENVFKKITAPGEPESRLAKAIIERSFIKVMFKKNSKEKK